MEDPLHRRFSTWGAIFGVLTSLWMVLVPAAMGFGLWFWFDFGAMAGDLALRGRPLPPFAGLGVLWWLGTVALPPAGFLLCWKVLRSRQVGLDNELTLARRRADRKALLHASEELWQAVEAAESAGDAAGQVVALDAWMAHAREVELTADLRADRIEQLREMARRVSPADPHAAVRMLEEARALTDARHSRRLGIWPAMRGDLPPYGVGFSAGLFCLPLLVLPVALVVWAFYLILPILTVAAVVVLLIIFFGGG